MSARTRAIATELNAPHLRADLAFLCLENLVTVEETTGLCNGPSRRLIVKMMCYLSPTWVGVHEAKYGRGSKQIEFLKIL